ncbi:MAG: hypothetical protein JSS33_01915, partial [Proteobacteria bacterium]|nr:hypothetical protein [Pseudomonadota bacterium]
MTDLLQRLRERKLVQWAIAYVAFAFALLQGVDIVAQQFGWPDGVRRGITLALAFGFFVALVLAWYHGERGVQRVSGTELLILALLLAIGGGLLWRFVRAPSTAPPATTTSSPAATAIPAKSIAVLPFVNMSADKENEFFSDGLSEEILNSLARIDGMQVVGRTSSFQFKGKNDDLRTIGTRLGVANVLEGSVRREGERARITAQLIRASDGYHLWSETYDRTLDDTLAVQLDIAEKVAGALNVLLDDTQRKRMRDAGVKNVDAFIAYQKAWKLYVDAHRGVSVGLLEGLRLANAQFDQAIALEPNYSMAHYAKADLYEHTLIDDGTTQAQRLDAQRGALQTLERAAATSPDAQQRELALAERQMLSDDWHGLANRLSSALAQPGCSAPNWMPVFASVFGYGEQLEPMLERAAICDPLNAITWNTRAWVARVIGKPDRIVSIYAQLRTYRPELPRTATEFLAQAMRGHQSESQTLPVPTDGLDANAYGIALQVARLRGMDRAQAQSWIGPINRDKGNIRDWQIVDLDEAALFGDRAQANRHAALLDARPAGGLLLAIATGYCGCGAPFDLDATPNFKARLTESGLPWPPPVA